MLLKNFVLGGICLSKEGWTSCETGKEPLCYMEQAPTRWSRLRVDGAHSDDLAGTFGRRAGEGGEGNDGVLAEAVPQRKRKQQELVVRVGG